MSYYELVSDTGNEPITLQLAQDQLRVNSDDDQELIDHYISSARTMFETDTDYVLTNQQYTLHLSEWTDEIVLEKYPISSVDSIKYYDEAGVQQTLSTTYYNVGNDARRTVIGLNDGFDFPDLQAGKQDAIQVTFTAGYADETTVPKDIKQALLLMITHFYDNRNAVTVGMSVAEMPIGYERIITRYRYFG